MKKCTQNAMLFFAAIMMVGCSPKAEVNLGSTKEVRGLPKKSEMLSETIEGKVTEITKGKDGYTAIITTDANEEFHATVSPVNLITPQQYRVFGVGEMVTVIGDYWKMEKKNQITVRVIQ